ncbi:cobalamin-binding protein [Alkalibaculum sp. M08DMB]|uniref:Cobalamin-binding protein n=1 Tax=Alkalibaculum sporogenes TaxID=2655001 RepID=A0A6A7KAG6_9FIRM|nr:cobalamin-dependent protein [Alkalibaculum sporogenes]MPW26177.1 cobalamin-binding protein [Alkalibaculum sporogenes]
MKNDIIRAMEELNEELLFHTIREALQQGKTVYDIQNNLNLGLELVGKKYETGEYYIADLIVAGELIKQTLKIEGMSFHTLNDRKYLGKVAVGTVFEDIHDVGKDIFISMLNSAGFETIDLGVDVSAEKFVQVIKEEKPDIIGISGVLSMMGANIKRIIDCIDESNLRSQVKIIVGGASVNNKLFEYVGADSFTMDASEGVNICKSWMGIQ